MRFAKTACPVGELPTVVAPRVIRVGQGRHVPCLAHVAAVCVMRAFKEQDDALCAGHSSLEPLARFGAHVSSESATICPMARGDASPA